MLKIPFRLAILGAIAWAPAVLHAQTGAAKDGYNNYRMLQARNIFDPDRSRDAALAFAREETHPAASTAPVQTAPKPADYVQLTGVMTTEEETFAFFAGSQPEYNKVVAVNGSIAGATITKITPAGIEVTRNGKQIAVPVGLTVPFDDSAPGLPPAASAPSTTSVTSATTGAGGVDPQAASQQVPVPDATSGSAAAPNNNISDAMRRMMERRQKELNQ